MSDQQIGIRNLIGADLNLVYSTWLKELHAADKSPLPSDIWFPAHREAIKRVLANPRTRCIVAHDPADPDEILGYCVATPGEWLHWIYIRPVFRGKKTGIVGLLMRAAGVEERTPAAWLHPGGKSLRNPPRPRKARGEYGPIVP